MADLPDRPKADEAAADAGQQGAAKPGKKQKEKKQPKEKPAQGQGSSKKDAGNADTKGITVKKEDDLSSWYQEILLKGDFLEYSDIPGCYIINVGALCDTSSSAC